MTYFKHIAQLALFLTTSAVPLVASAQLTSLGCRQYGGAGIPAAGTDLLQPTLATPITTEFPDAVCNDGTDAIFYVRAGSGDGANRWVVYLPGGGSCSDANACAERWCGAGTNFSSDKMSSFGMSAGIRGTGIFDGGSATNEFANWNGVYIHHCSSDLFAGDSPLHSFVTQSPHQNVPDGYAFDIQFKGAKIVEAVVGLLRRENGLGQALPPVEYDSDDDGHVDATMPDLDDADVVLLVGSGVGNQGVGHHADRLGAELCQHHVSTAAGGPCTLDFRAVFDAGVIPNSEDMDWQGVYGNTYDYAIQQRWNGYYDPIWNAQVDDSCIALHPGEEWRCADPTHVLHNHITTPFFAREDLLDPNAAPDWAFYTELDFAVLAHRNLTNLAYLDYTAEEGSYLTPGNPPLVPPGVFGPQCAHHVAIRNNSLFTNVTVNIPGGNAVNFHDTLVNWLSGASRQVAIERVPTSTATMANCPP